MVTERAIRPDPKPKDRKVKPEETPAKPTRFGKKKPKEVGKVFPGSF